MMEGLNSETMKPGGEDELPLPLPVASSVTFPCLTVQSLSYEAKEHWLDSIAARLAKLKADYYAARERALPELTIQAS